MAASQGRAVLIEALDAAWRTMLEVRDRVKDEGMGIMAARLTRLCSEVDEVKSVLGWHSPEVELAAPVAAELAARATAYAEQAVEGVELEVPDPMEPVTNAIASAFVIGYGACIDDSKSAKVIHRGRRAKR